MKPATTLTAAAALALAFSATAWAGPSDRTGLYGFAGASKSDVFTPGKNQQGLKSDRKWSDGKLGYTVGVGYRISPNFAVEGAYHRQASESRSSSRSKGADTAVAGGYTGSYASASALGILPIGDRFELFSRIGVASMQTSFKADRNSALDNRSSRQWAMQYGFGATMNLGDNSFLRTEWSMLKPNGKSRAAQAVGRDRVRHSQIGVAFGHRF
ncbi:outer membrane beta-barrel protein [Stenotrophomonas maltophilia]|uniref:outer membrane beta-barrel protein n=1 Tax=Stenotrophomonas maltophilia TaxID=40324 RepID=UPI00066D17D8|nr:outer membrane beta-barrel protein [Stenotrophomonas maltophilia]